MCPQTRIHILGIGNLGKLVAHSLREAHPSTPITLLFHRPNLVEEWDRAGRCIEVVRNSQSDRRSGFDHECISKGRSKIENLIVATKSHATTRAIQPLVDRVSSSSTLLFLQNGIGAIDEVTSFLLAHSPCRPKILAGIVNHGVFSSAPFSAVHAGLANMFLGPVRPPSTTDWAHPGDQGTFLLQQILDAPPLAASFLSAPSLLQAQLQKLAINSIINPLTAIFDCLNGKLFPSPEIRALIQTLISEISTVIRAIITSRSEHRNPDVLNRFLPECLENSISEVAAKTAENISSMRQDVRAGRRTEIDYINGYIVAQGAAYGIKCPKNLQLLNLVKSRALISVSDIAEVFGV